MLLVSRDASLLAIIGFPTLGPSPIQSHLPLFSDIPVCRLGAVYLADPRSNQSPTCMRAVVDIMRPLCS